MTSNDLFLLMVSLSQVNNVDHIKRLFIDAMNDGCRGLSFAISPEPDANAAVNIKVAGENIFFFYLSICGDFSSFSAPDQAQIRNAIALLTIILENRHNAELLRAQNVSLAESVRENQEMIANIARTAPMIIYIYDFTTQTSLFVNREISHVTGYSRQELEDKEFMNRQNFFYPEDKIKLIRHYHRLKKMSCGSQADIEYRIHDKEGRMHWLFARNTPYKKDENGITTSILGCAADITDRKLDRQKLADSLAEKEVLLKEVHHRTKNNMQVIMSLLTLQAGHSKNEEVTSVFKTTKNRILSMALVHNKLYQSNRLSIIELRDYLTDLISRLVAGFSWDDDSIQTSITGENVLISMEMAIPCGLVMNEIITNTLKHGFSGPIIEETKRIEIELIKEKHSITINYRDNGRGLEKPVNPGTSQGLGMQLIQSIIKNQLQGEVVFKNQQGFAVSLTFPGESYEI